MTCLRFTALLALLICLVTGCGQTDPPYEPGPRPVKITVVGEPQGAVTRSFSGMARAAADTVLSFRVGGVLQSLPVQVGQAVQAGELMARLDATDYQLKVLELEAHVARARAAFIKAEADYARIRALFEGQTVSRSELDQARAGLDSTTAELEAAQKNLELVRQQLSYTLLHAPGDGTISAVPVENYQTVQAGQPIAVLSTDQEMEFEVGLPDRLIQFVTLGDSALIVFDVLPGHTFPARVSEIAITPGAVSTYPVKLRLEEPVPQIRPGMIGQATFKITPSNGEPFTVVPAEAVFGLPDGSQAVWLVDPRDDTVHQRPVVTGRILTEGLQILEGLATGDSVVIRGVHRLEHGQQVRPMNHAPDKAQ